MGTAKLSDNLKMPTSIAAWPELARVVSQNPRHFFRHYSNLPMGSPIADKLNKMLENLHSKNLSGWNELYSHFVENSIRYAGLFSQIEVSHWFIHQFPQLRAELECLLSNGYKTDIYLQNRFPVEITTSIPNDAWKRTVFHIYFEAIKSGSSKKFQIKSDFNKSFDLAYENIPIGAETAFNSVNTSNDRWDANGAITITISPTGNNGWSGGGMSTIHDRLVTIIREKAQQIRGSKDAILVISLDYDPERSLINTDRVVLPTEFSAIVLWWSDPVNIAPQNITVITRHGSSTGESALDQLSTYFS